MIINVSKGKCNVGRIYRRAGLSVLSVCRFVVRPTDRPVHKHGRRQEYSADRTVCSKLADRLNFSQNIGKKVCQTHFHIVNALYGTLHGTLYGTLHGTPHGTPHGTLYGTLHGTLHGSPHGTLYGTLHGTLHYAKSSQLKK